MPAALVETCQGSLGCPAFLSVRDHSAVIGDRGLSMRLQKQSTTEVVDVACGWSFSGRRHGFLVRPLWMDEVPAIAAFSILLPLQLDSETVTTIWVPSPYTPHGVPCPACRDTLLASDPLRCFLIRTNIVRKGAGTEAVLTYARDRYSLSVRDKRYNNTQCSFVQSPACCQTYSLRLEVIPDAHSNS